MERFVAWWRDAIIITLRLGREAVLSFRQNWSLGVLSVALAVALWVFVTEREDPERVGRVPGTVPIEVVNLSPDRVVFPPLEDDSVSVRARAPESVFDDLTAEDFRATIDLSDVIGDEADVPVEVEPLRGNVEVVDAAPSVVRVRLQNVVSKTVPVLASEGELGGLPPGFRLGSVEVDVDEATVTGREQLVADVAFVQPDIDLMGARTDFEQRAPLEAIGQGGGLLQGVTIEPETAVVTVDIVQTEFTSTFLVRPIVRGQPASGFRVTGLEWDPVFVEVTGTLEALSNIDPVRGVETEPLNIDGATSDVVSTRALRVPSGAEAEVANVTIRVTIEAQPAPQQQSSRGSPWLGAWRPRLS